MTGKKGIMTTEDLVSLRLCYHILDLFELLAPSEGETLRSHCKGCVCLNEWMFKAGVRIPLEFGILELLSTFSATPIQILPNSWRIIQSVLWFCEWRKCRANRHLWVSLISRKVILVSVSFAGKRNTKIIPNLPDLVSKWKLQFFYARFRAGEESTHAWGIPMAALEFLQLKSLKWHSAKGAFLRWCEGLPLFGSSGVLLCGELVGSLGPSSGTRSSSEGSRASASHRTDNKARLVERPKKRKRLVYDLVGQGHQLMAVNKRVEEEAERQNEENLQLEFHQALLPEVSLGPAPGGPSLLGLVSSPVMGDVDEASSCPSNEEIFRRPFNMEARAMKILGDLLPIASRSTRENYALGLLPSLDVEGLKLDEQMLREYVPDVWKELLELEERLHLTVLTPEIDSGRLGSWRRSVGRLLPPGSALRKRLWSKRLGRSESLWRKHALKLGVLQERGWRLRGRGIAPKLLEMGCRAHRAKARREEAGKALVNLHSVVDAARADLEVARDDTEGLEASVQRFSGQAKQAREEISWLMSKIDVLRAERDEAIRKALATNDRALQFSTEPPIPNPRARDTGLDVGEESSPNRKALAVREQIAAYAARGWSC
ncbi:hypothetical protein ACLOJK_037169 [Asimina triloba]